MCLFATRDGMIEDLDEVASVVKSLKARQLTLDTDKYGEYLMSSTDLPAINMKSTPDSYIRLAVVRSLNGQSTHHQAYVFQCLH